MNEEQVVLQKALEFHYHLCWASVAGVRTGARRTAGAEGPALRWYAIAFGR